MTMSVLSLNMAVSRKVRILPSFVDILLLILQEHVGKQIARNSLPHVGSLTLGWQLVFVLRRLSVLWKLIKCAPMIPKCILQNVT